ncbi:MAG: hypothetical protein KJ905_03770 [Nanoarchaeota archaeon]|nr:hypothetical protein [Nanoarchaeota archaeon]MBU1501859.1 hypothetical protein [Nanoarchaeota archaeon]MBU2458853.1 hypothetical protein [Nanoarchaeota archaeon]
MGILDNKKGLSVIIATVILIAMTMVIAGIVWTTVSNLVNTETSEAESCFGLFEKVNFERKYTCYDSVDEETQFSIKIGDLDIDEVIVGISTNTTGKSFSIKKIGSTVPNLKMFDGLAKIELITLPGKESGETYIFNMVTAGIDGVPIKVEIIPVIDGTQCEVADTVQDFGTC